MNRVLVTGASGFIGKRLIYYLLQNNVSIRALTRNNHNSLPLSKVEIFTGDLTKRETLIGACQQIDTIFHLGGYAHAWDSNNISFSDKHQTINFQGTKNILEEAIQCKVKRFIFFSSVKAVADSEFTIDENWEKLPDSPYGIAKRQAEQLVLASKETGMHVCVLRPALVYGPKWKGNLHNMLQAIDRGHFPPLPKIKNIRSMISVDDICTAAILAAQHPIANGKIYFVTDGVSYSTSEIYALMREALGKQIPNWHVPLLCFNILAFLGDTASKIFGRNMPFGSEALSKLFGSAHFSSVRIQKELGFAPIYDFRKMLPYIIKQYRVQHDL